MNAGFAPPRWSYAPSAPACASPLDTVTLSDPLDTNWPFAPNQNRYNQAIRDGVAKRWGDYSPPLPELLFKSLICQESNFDPKAVSPSGYAGLSQISKAAARAEGLIVTSSKDERFVPAKNIRAGVGVLQGKLDLVLNPEKMAASYPYAAKVVQAYEQYGRPTGPDQIWCLGLGAYNGGQGTVLRTMARAFERGLDPRDWANLIEPRTEPEKSPLYATTLEVFGTQKAMAKYREISKYPLEILARTR